MEEAAYDRMLVRRRRSHSPMTTRSIVYSTVSGEGHAEEAKSLRWLPGSELNRHAFRWRILSSRAKVFVYGSAAKVGVGLSR